MRLKIPRTWAISRKAGVTKPEVIPTINASGEPRSVTVKAGEVYVFQQVVTTRAGFEHVPGDLLLVVDGTSSAPFGEISQSGTNWLCDTKHSTSVWATLEQCIARGLLQLRD